MAGNQTIHLGRAGMARFLAAEWHSERPEPSRSELAFLKDISARKNGKAPFGVLEIAFQTAGGGIFHWRPRWDDVVKLFYRAYMTEECNLADNREELEKFRQMAQEVVELSDDWASKPRHGG